MHPHTGEYRKTSAPKFSEQLPCRSAEVKFFSVFLCQRCREIRREILVKFSVLRFPGFGCATENFTKISRQKRCEKRRISRKFHSAGRGSESFCPLAGDGRRLTFSNQDAFPPATPKSADFTFGAFFAYSPLRRLLEALSHRSKQTSIVSKKGKAL